MLLSIDTLANGLLADEQNMDLSSSSRGAVGWT